MGMYTEIYFNGNIGNPPEEVLDVLRCIVGEYTHEHPRYDEILAPFPPRFDCLACDCSYYTPRTQAGALTYDSISNEWSLIIKGDLKNYDNEVNEFFDFIEEYAEDDVMGYHRYEAHREPTLVYKATISEDRYE